MATADFIFNATDLRMPIREIRSQSKDNMIQRLVRIQDGYQLEDVKSLDWVAELKCLSHIASRKRVRGQGSLASAPSKSLGREIVDGRVNLMNNYVEVSYPCNAITSSTSSDNVDTGAWRVHAIPGSHSYQSKVRGIVLDRSTAYAARCGTPPLPIWIDMESIPQKDCSEKQTAIQSMDLVYKFSSHPVALIFTRINTKDEINLLTDLLSESKLYKPKSLSRLLQLLWRITSDPWWERAWTFQEDYLAGKDMVLLIPHDLQLTKVGDVFGHMEGELQVKSAAFRDAATSFCLWYQDNHQLSGDEDALCRNILQKAGKYTILLDGSKGGQEYSKTMSARIFQDVASKRATVPSDFLAIVANCCSYTARLDTKKIEDAECSLSLSTLDLYFLNGEIFKNNQFSTTARTTRLTTLEYLDHISLDSFDCPCRGYKLSFLKCCRFIHPRLTFTGVVTKGVLWHLDHAICTQSEGSIFRRGDDVGKTELLCQLVVELDDHGFESLACKLEKFLEYDYVPRGGQKDPHKPSKYYMSLMADSIAAAIEDGETLLLAKAPGTHGKDAFFGIFNMASRGERLSSYRSGHYPRYHHPYNSYAFTAWKGAGPDAEAAMEETKLDNFVSLEVDLDENASNSVDRDVLRTKRWMNGLCFFTKEDEKHVTFPWPRGLAD